MAFPDEIIAAIYDFIKTERQRNFSFLGRYNHRHKDLKELLMVEPADTSDATTLKHKTTNRVFTGWFTFTEPRGRSRRTVAIRALKKGNVKIQSMLIGMGTDRMVDAATWMRDTYCTDYDIGKFSEMQYEEQRLWWATNGQSFRLLQLPLEMRESIYLQAIGPVCVPDFVTVGRQKRLVLGVGQSFQKRSHAERNRDPDVQRPNLNILRVNKQVNREAMTVACCNVVKRFTTLRSNYDRGPRSCPLTLRDAAWHFAPRFYPETSFLRRVQLEMSAVDYFASIDIRPRSHEPLAFGPGPLPLRHLVGFSNLRKLDLRFISPKHRLARCPWTQLSPGEKFHSCQKKWIPLVFVLAWDELWLLRERKHIEISTSGCIKNSTRSYWEGKLNSLCAEDTASVKEMERKAREVIHTHGIDAMLLCECSNPCGVRARPGTNSTFADHDDASFSRIEGWQNMLDKAYWDFED